EEKAIIDAARELGLSITPFHLHTSFLLIGGGSQFKDPFNPGETVVIQRAISHAVALNSTLVLESAGLRVINNSAALARALNKVWTLSLLAKAGIQTPRSAVVFSEEAGYKLTSLLNYPLVIKPIDGSWGRLVALIRDNEELRTILEHRAYIQSPNMKIHLIQEYVEKPGRDIRVFTIGDEVVTAIYRVSEHWITNTARGGRAEPARVDHELEDIALKTARVLGVEFAGIDVFEDKHRGYVVNEVNSIPEFKNTVIATGCKVHVRLVEYVKNLLKK
ncbi:MAG: lysine biosynthesis protein LysX, partial [Desulfurococcaceae archaeon]